MRPVRFVALSEDGQALVLTDEVGRLLALPIDERVQSVLRTERGMATQGALSVTMERVALSPRDIQARIRSGESAEDVARVAGVPVDRVLRYAGPVLQERAMLAQHARRTKLKSSEKGQTLAEVVDARLGQHGVEAEKISWDAYRRDDGTWRILASWPSGKATAQAVWELDKARRVVAPFDEMANYLCTERPSQILAQDPSPVRHGHALPGPTRGESSRGSLGPRPEPTHPAGPDRETTRPAGGRGLGAPDPIRAGRDALLASLERPLNDTPVRSDPGQGASAPAASARPGMPEPVRPHRGGVVRGGAAALIGVGGAPAGEETEDLPTDVPAVPSLAVLRPRRSAPAQSEQPSDKPRKRLPSWDDVLFGGAPAARESS